MSHPESDGATEMLEGGIRAVSTGALRMVETVQRRQQWAARRQTDRFQHDTGRVEQQQRALSAVDDIVRGGPRTRSRATPTAVAGQEPHGSSSVVPTARQLFPHFAPDVAEAGMNDLVVHGDLSAYLHAHRAAAEAGRTGRTPDAAELHRRAVDLFTDARHETAATHHDRADARELETLRHHLAADPMITTLEVSESGSGAGDLEQADPVGAAADGYDTTAARERRADAVRAQDYDEDTTASALLHDLSFGVPAAAAVRLQTSPTAARPAKAVRRSRGRTEQLTR